MSDYTNKNSAKPTSNSSNFNQNTNKFSKEWPNNTNQKWNKSPDNGKIDSGQSNKKSDNLKIRTILLKIKSESVYKRSKD